MFLSERKRLRNGAKFKDFLLCDHHNPEFETGKHSVCSWC
jgi:hypothetical protein